MATISAIDVLKSIGTFIERWNLKNAAVALAKDMSTIKTPKELTAWLKKKINPFVADVGMIFYNKTVGKKLKVSDTMTLITKGVSIVDNALALFQECAKPKTERSKTLIAKITTDITGDILAIVNPLKKLSGDKTNWFLSIATAGVGLISNLIATTDGINDKEKTALNKSYVMFLKSIDSQVTKKFFDDALTAEIKSASEKDLDEVLKNSKLIQNLGKKITAPGGPLDLIFSFVTGITNGIDKHNSRLEKYTADGIPEKIAKHDAVVDAIATIIHDTLSGFVKGADDVVFAFVQKVLMGDKVTDESKTYVDVIADLFKTLNPTNSGTSGDDKVIYVLENKSMVYGDDGDDYIGNFGFSNVTIWGGHDDDTLGSYKTDSATPQKNSIFGGPGDDEISVYDEKSTIHGGTGNDSVYVIGTKNQIFGDEGDDILYIAEGASNNTISGGKSNDIIALDDKAKGTLIKYTSGDGNDSIVGFNEDDSLKIIGSYKTSAVGNDFLVTAGEGSVLLVGMAGKNININGKTRKRGEEDPTAETVIPSVFPTFPTMPATVLSPIIRGTNGDDTINSRHNKIIIQALSGDDVIYNLYGYGGYYNVSINSGAGNDSISNRGLYALINAGAGDDSIDNDGGSDTTVDSGTGNDVIKNHGDSIYDCTENVMVNAGEGNDSIYNSEYTANVLINGGNGDDHIYNEPVTQTGFGHYDTLSGNDISVNGGAGNDYICNHTEHSGTWVSHGGNRFIAYGGSGNDTILNNGNNSTLDGNGGNELIITGNFGESGGGEGYFNSILGGDGDDTIVNRFTGYNSTIDGGAGNDYIENSGKKVSISSDAGDDFIFNGKERTSGAPEVTIDAGAGSDTIEHRGNSSKISGGDGNDSIYSHYGYAGTICYNVSIKGGKGNDTIENYAMNSFYEYAAGDGNDIIEGFNETSTLSITGGNYSTKISDDDVIVTVGEGKITLVGAANLDNVNIAFTKILTVTDSTSSPVTVGSSVKIIDASTRTTAVKITGNAKANTISGGSSKDSLYGGKGNDSLFGNAGNDKIYGGAGKDTLIGGKGNDSLWGGDGKDIFFYADGDGKDIIYGFDSKDTLTFDGLEFTSSYNKSKGTITFKVDGGSVILKDFGATTTFHVNDDIYKISGSKLIKK